MFGFRRKSIEFKELAQSDECESLTHESEKSEETKSSQKYRPSWILTSILLLVAFPVAALIGAKFGGHLFINSNELCIHKVSQDSPLLEDIDISFSTIRFNGSLLKENIFRLPASPEVDAAWQSLGVDYTAVIVPPQLAEKAGLLPSQVQVNEKYGGGFPANVEGLHHLHCLNLLRQGLYFNYDYYHDLGQGAFKNEDFIVRYHVTHCLDIIRQQLMCQVDIGVLGQIWYDKETPTPYVDFFTQHKCRNFDAVRQWAFEHQAPTDTPEDYLQPPKSEEDVYESMP